jgi:hypothetical protein
MMPLMPVEQVRKSEARLHIGVARAILDTLKVERRRPGISNRRCCK